MAASSADRLGGLFKLRKAYGWVGTRHRVALSQSEPRSGNQLVVVCSAQVDRSPAAWALCESAWFSASFIMSANLE